MPENRNHTSKIKLFITIGYSVLLVLVVYGVVRIYLELMKFSEQSDPFQDREEFVEVGNVLTSMYESEAMSKMMFSSIDIDRGRLLFDSLQHQVVIQIDWLRKSTTDSLMQVSLDSVLVLLDRKNKNTHSILQLIDSLNQPRPQKSITTLLSQKNIRDLNRISKIRTQQRQDSIVVQVQKKTFMKKLSDVFRSDVKDSIYVKSNNASELVDSILPIENIEDTIMQFVTDIVQDYDTRRTLLTAQLIYKQNQMHHTNSDLAAQINTILRDLELREYRKSYLFLQKKEQTLSRSSSIVFNVALAALITVIFFLLISLRSISREMRYQKQLELAKKYAEDLLKNKEKLMLTISHDIKAPLSSIIGYIEMLAKSKLLEKDRYYLRNMRYSSEQVLELVTKLLDYHRLKSGNLEIHLMSFSPHRLFEDIHQSFIPLVAQKNLEFEFVNSLHADRFYQGDPFRIRQIVNNLMSNAVKFTHSGKITFTASVSLDGDKHLLNIVVKDTGIGIDPENTEKIFEEYHRLEDAESETIEGSGLGLTISRKLATLLNGDIRVVSEWKRGSEFIVTIPLKTEFKEDNNLSASKKNSLKILFVDDDQVLLNMYKEFLKQEGFLPIMTTRSLDALTLLQDMTFDIVFTDIQMPDMNGFELVERIRMATFPGAKDIPVIALSARSGVSEQKLKDVGFSGFIAKPFSVEQLLNVITTYSGVSASKRKDSSEKGLAALTAFAGKDKGAAVDIITTYIKENELLIDELEKYAAADDESAIRAIAHRLLPLMRMINADDIVAILYNLENHTQEKSVVYKLADMLKQKNKEAETFLTEELSV